jgi:chromosome partitioning protein
MRTLAFLTQKGGAGKSTLASNLAVAATLAGERVVVLDLDSTRSLATWAKQRGRPDIAVESVPPGKLAKTLEAVAKKGVTLAILDAPGHDGEEFDAAIAAADLCIIPSRPNAFDLWASEITRVKVKAAGKDYAFLLNQCPPAQQNQRVEQGAKALQAMGGLLAPLVSARVDYQEAARQGLAVCETHPHGVAAQEIRDLWSGLKRRFKKSVAKPTPAPAAKVEAKPESKVEAKVEAPAPVKLAAKAAAKPVAARKVAAKQTRKAA